MALVAQNWTLNTYTNGAWTDLVDASAASILKAIVVSVGSNAAVVKVRITDSTGTNLASLLPAESAIANSAFVVNTTSVVLEAGQKLQVQADVAGVEFSAHGVASE